MSTFGLPSELVPSLSIASFSCVQQIFSPCHQCRTPLSGLCTATWQGDRLSPAFVSHFSAPTRIDQQKRWRRRGKGKWWLAVVALGKSVKG